MTQDEPVVVCGGAFLSTFPQGLDAMNAVSSLDSVPDSLASQPSIAVLIPCLNEAAAIGKVIADFKAHLPTAWIFVYDNGSTDDTVKIARAAGAVVRIEPIRGKGNVVRRMFADVEAAYRRGHVLGNRLLTGLVAAFFGNRISDLLSGYRVFSRRFVKSFPALTTGFEIETELSVHALQLRMPIGEVNTDYRERPAGSASKLSTYKDGFRILRTIAVLVKEEKPLAFFSVVSLVLVVIALALGVPVVVEFTHTGLVPRFPTALLASAIVILSFLSFACGLILDTVSRGRAETRRLAYLSFPVRFSSIKPREFMQSRR